MMKKIKDLLLLTTQKNLRIKFINKRPNQTFHAIPDCQICAEIKKFKLAKQK